MFDKGNVFPTIEKAFPGVFESEAVEVEEIKNKRELELYKAKFLDYAYRHNSSRKEESL